MANSGQQDVSIAALVTACSSGAGSPAENFSNQKYPPSNRLDLMVLLHQGKRTERRYFINFFSLYFFLDKKEAKEHSVTVKMPYTPGYSAYFTMGNPDYATMVVQGSWKDFADNKIDNMKNRVLIWANGIGTYMAGKTDTMAIMETWRINKDGKSDMFCNLTGRTGKNNCIDLIKRTQANPGIFLSHIHIRVI